MVWKYRRKERISTTTAAAAAVVIALKFHPKHVKNKNKTKHMMKISHINIIHDKKIQQVNQIVIKMLNKYEN